MKGLDFIETAGLLSLRNEIVIQVNRIF